MRWTTMSANKEETIVINPLALQAPATTLERFELRPVNQAKIDAVRRSRLDGTYTPPAGMVEWQRLNPLCEKCKCSWPVQLCTWLHTYVNT